MTDLNNASVSTLDLLDASLDDMADLPEWKIFPAGVYRVKPEVKQESKKQKGESVTVITVTATLLEGGIKEKNDPASADPAVGSQTNVRFTWENEYGQGGLKNLLKPISAATGVKKVGDLLQLLGTADSVLLVMGVRKSSKDGKDYENQTFTDLILE